MVLLSFLFVLAAAVTLVIGLVGTGLGLIYVSIACSLAAGLVLAAAVVRSRPTAELAAAGPAPLPTHNEPHSFASAPSAARTPATGSLDVGERIRVFAEPEPPTSVLPPAEPEIDIEPAGEDVFAPPVYDAEPEPEPVEVSAASDWSVGDDDWADDDGGDVFPIADYDSLRVSQVLPLLGELDADELEVVREREVDVKGGRVSVLNRIDLLLGRPIAAPPVRKAPAKKAAAPAPAPAPAKKVAKKAAATPAKKAAPTKKAAATPAKKAAPAAAKKATRTTKKQP